jgi:hypothetical protein
LAHIFANNKCADCADVDDAKFAELFREKCGAAKIPSADINCPQKNDPAHLEVTNERASGIG